MSGLSYRDSHVGKGRDYHDLFASNRHRRMMWAWEQSIISQVIDGLAQPALRHLDFACGTGRVLKFVSSRATHSTGVDVSETMLEIARSASPAAEILNADLTQADRLDRREFDFITAFRFFPNAEVELRREAMTILSQHLSAEGVLMFNNHLKMGSAAHIAERLIGRDRKRRMTHAEVVDLVTGAGLKIFRVWTHGCLPMTERFTPLPSALLGPIEDFCSRLPILRPLAQNWVYACVHQDYGHGNHRCAQ